MSRSSRIARSASTLSVPLTSTTGAGRTASHGELRDRRLRGGCRPAGRSRHPLVRRRSAYPRPHAVPCAARGVAASARSSPSRTTSSRSRSTRGRRRRAPARRASARRGRCASAACRRREDVEQLVGRMPVVVVRADADQPDRRAQRLVQRARLVGRAVVGDLDDIDVAELAACRAGAPASPRRGRRARAAEAAMHARARGVDLRCVTLARCPARRRAAAATARPSASSPSIPARRG